MKKEKGYEGYVLVHNTAKRDNVGTLAWSCTNFGFSELILVGRRHFNAFGSHGSTSHLNFCHFHSLPEAQSFLKEHSVMAKLQNEVDVVVGDRFPTVKDVKKLKYTTRVINEDILRFHAVYWPAMLVLAELPLYKMVFGHGFLTKD